MELTNEFNIDRPIDDTWRILNDLEFIAPCMPGAQLQEIEGDEYRGIVKIKVGPITAKYAGKASFIEQNEPAKTAKLKAEGRDPRQGNANALITATMESVSDTVTTVKIHTDLSLSGKIASFGRGAIEDVSKKILTQFSDNLRDKLEAGEAPTAETTDAAPAAEAASTDTAAPAADASAAAPAADAAAGTPAAASSAAPAAETPGESKVRKIESPEPKPVDILAVTGDSVAKRVAPVIGAVVLLILLKILLGRRG
ncbi:MAG: SRPBCC family protein [Acidimicrobiales bacterium]